MRSHIYLCLYLADIIDQSISSDNLYHLRKTSVETEVIKLSNFTFNMSLIKSVQFITSYSESQ